jgi:Flp pilus assembly protein TadD
LDTTKARDFDLWLGRAHAALGHPALAARCFRRSLARADRAETRAFLGEALLRSGRFRRAFLACKAALELEPGHPQALAVLDMVKNEWTEKLAAGGASGSPAAQFKLA